MQEQITPEELRQFIHIRDKYLPTHLIGEGTFSTVYKAIDITNSSPHDIHHVALKNITRTTAPHRIYDELKILKLLSGKYCTVPLLSVKRFEDQVIAVFPYFPFTDFRSFAETCTIDDIRHYVFSLITSLKWVHENNIIHRDIKPSNFLYDMRSRRGLLIDFGLAQFQQERKTKDSSRKSVIFNTSISKVTLPPGYYINDTRKVMKAERSGTRGFRAPEVLFKVQDQTVKIDMWCVGVIMLILLSRQYPFFLSMDDIDSLIEIGNIFGQREMKSAARFYKRVWKSNIGTIPNERVPFEVVIKRLNPEMVVGNEAVDLLQMLMELKDERRLAASDALDHPFLRKL